MFMIHKVNSTSVLLDNRESNYSMRTAINPKEYPQVHDFYEFSLVAKGGFNMRHESYTYNLKQGDLILTRPGTIHSKIEINGTASVHINLAFPKSAMNEVLQYLYGVDELEFFKEKSNLYHLSANYLEFIKSEMGKLSSIYSANIAFERSHMRWLLVELLHNVINIRYTKENNTSLPAWLSKLLQDFDDPNQINKGFTLIMSEVGLSNEHIIRSFKKHLNKTPLEYYNIKRLDLAANMLAHTDVPIPIISENLGFYSLAYFYKKFKKAYNVTPRAYRLKSGQFSRF